MAPSALKNLSKREAWLLSWKAWFRLNRPNATGVKGSQLLGDGLLTHPTTIALNSHWKAEAPGGFRRYQTGCWFTPLDLINLYNIYITKQKRESDLQIERFNWKSQLQNCNKDYPLQ